MKINVNECVGCGQCIDMCTHKAISINRVKTGYGEIYIDSTLCINCGECMESFDCSGNAFEK
jgi:ferredoxin